MSPLPANATKHLNYISHPLPRDPSINLHLKQISSSSTKRSSDDGDGATQDGHQGSTGTTGTTLWLGAQVMACYLRETLVTPPTSHSAQLVALNQCSDPKKKSNSKILELGSGVGYLALFLASRGFNVIATDIEPVVSDVLKVNVENGLRILNSENAVGGGEDGGKDDTQTSVGQIEILNLDWEEVAKGFPIGWAASDSETPPQFEESVHGNGGSVNPGQVAESSEVDIPHLSQIITTDTLYHPALIQPLFKTLRHLSTLPDSAIPITTTNLGDPSPGLGRKGGVTFRPRPPIVIALENRDPSMISEALRQAKEMGFDFKRVSSGRVGKAVEKSGWGWAGDDWDGIEIWRGRYKG